jgi:hypothetical protein
MSLLALCGCSAPERRPPPEDLVPVEPAAVERTTDRPEEDAPEEAEPDEEEPKELLDTSFRFVSRNVSDIAGSVDSFFGDPNLEEGFNATRLRLRLGGTLADHGRSEAIYKIKLNLDLPRTKKRARFFLESFTEEDDETVDEDFDGSTDEDENIAAGLRYFFRAKDYVQLNLDVGVKFRPEPDPFVRLRGTRTFQPADYWRIRPTQYVWWESQDKFGASTRLDVDRRLLTDSLLRFRGRVTWEQKKNGVEFDGSVNFYERADPNLGVRISARLKGETRPATVIRRYTLSARLRKLVYRDWVYLEVEPAMDFFRDDDYEPSPGLTLVIEAVFGGDPWRKDREREERRARRGAGRDAEP